MEINGAKMFVKALQEEGVDTLFAYPGGTAIDLFDALYDAEGIDMILPRHEQALVHAADGYARSTGRVGVCLVTSGPGATNLVTGIATANYDSVPLVCFTGHQAFPEEPFPEERPPYPEPPFPAGVPCPPWAYGARNPGIPSSAPASGSRFQPSFSSAQSGSMSTSP